MSISEAYNTWAIQYDSNENKTRDLDKIATIKSLEKFQFENVLELGCGTGKNTEFFLTKAEKLIGLDFSEEMLKYAQIKIKDPKVDLNKDWLLKDDFANLITSSLTLEHIENLDHIFKQANRKSKKNAFFFICELHPFKQYLGSKAKYETEDGVHELKVYVHHISDYIESALKNNFDLYQIREWFDDENKNQVPRLISFIFKKNDRPL